jgi:chromate reductase
MEQIQIIAGTNRKDSLTMEVALTIKSLLSPHFETNIIELAALNGLGLVTDVMYTPQGAEQVIRTVQKEYLIPSRRWIIVSPEYNGSFPGILKLWLDMLSVSDADKTFHQKKIGLVGVSSGRAGNLRGMDHLTAVLHYLQAEVMPFKLPVSSVSKLFDQDGNPEEELILPLQDFVSKYMKFTGIK